MTHEEAFQIARAITAEAGAVGFTSAVATAIREAWDDGYHTGKDLAFALMPKTCVGCGQYYADPPSPLCPGCQTYEEHTR